MREICSSQLVIIHILNQVTEHALNGLGRRFKRDTLQHCDSKRHEGLAWSYFVDESTK